MFYNQTYMNINYLALLIATIAQFAVGATWYSVLFGKLWGQIHGFDKLPKATQQKMMKEMGPYYGVQLLLTIVTSFILALFISNVPDWSPYAVAALLWLGFVVPTQVSAVIFGRTDSKWIVKKVAVQAGASLACLEVAAAIFNILA